MSLLTDVANLVLDCSILAGTLTTAWVTIRKVNPRVTETHGKVAELANGTRARTDQLEQTLQAAGVDIPPLPPHPGETGSEPN